jgi:hypothetical protein
MNEDEYNAVGVEVLFCFFFSVSGGWMLWNRTNYADIMMMMMLLRMLRRMMMIKCCK